MQISKSFRVSALASLAFVAAGAIAGCGSESNTPVADDSAAAEERRAALGSVASEVVGLYGAFQDDASALDVAVDAWIADPTPENRTLAQDAWRAAIGSWQKAEVTQFGPAGSMSAVEGGEDLRDRIYSWPLTNTCRIDQVLAAEGYASSEFGSERVNIKGLDALEYLLFVESTENTCAPNSILNSEGAWAELTEEEITTRRAAYAGVLADGVVEASDELMGWWSADGKNFESELATAGEESSTYQTSQEALNAVSDALFYLEKETKDMKVAPPVGLSTCTETACPELRESKFANASLEHVRNNIDGFSVIYMAGFDPLLREVGATDLADEMVLELEEAKAAFAAFDASMVGLLEADRAALVAAHDELREFVLLFKTQFLSVLDLEVPKRAEGDND